MALIPPFFLDCVVAVGFPGPDGLPRYTATGFLYGQFIERHDDGGTSYRIFFVTNKHVLGDAKIGYLRFNPEAAEPARAFRAVLRNEDGTPRWTGHPDPDVDLAVLLVSVEQLQAEGIRFSFFQGDLHVVTRAQATDLDITEGIGVFVLGFPMGLVGDIRNFVIVRQGTIARIRDALAHSAKTFLIDCTIFPGNSGGPVVCRPEAMAIQGTKNLNQASLIGVVAAYVPYRDVAVSQQTQRPRIIFEENSGLAMVIPADYIEETIQAAMPVSPARDEDAQTEVAPGEDPQVPSN